MADDDVTDLTEEEQSDTAAAAGQKAAKEPKAPKLPKEPKEPKTKVPKQKGEKSGGAGGIIVILFLLLIILAGGLVSALALDMFNSRAIIADVFNEPLTNLIIWLDPEYSSIQQQLRDEEQSLEADYIMRNEQLDAREAAIVLRENAFSSREIQLDRRESDLDNREDLIVLMYERAVPLFRREPMSEQDLEDMDSLSRIYSSMQPAAAAERILELYDPRDAAAILYFMSEGSAAAILQEMLPAFAAEITEILLYH